MATKYAGKDLLIQRLVVAPAVWVALTAYTVGDAVTNSSKTYRCIGAGTSASSGGPTGSSASPITDGTVTWSYVGAGDTWLIDTVYAYNALVSNSGNTYRCTIGGTSAHSGGPTGTGSAITDNTCTWAYVGAATSDLYETIAGMKSTSLSINNEQVDVTEKGSVPWRQLLAVGIRSMELSASGVFTNDFALNDIMSDVTNGSIQKFKIVSGRGDIFMGYFLVASCERSGEYNGAEQYTLSLSSAGTITYTAPTA